ncbi:MAG: hypothetical protein IT324_30685 [Anaerolineae bacterium]|nr:hypothetical protein [Anaerolineae bacterium]
MRLPDLIRYGLWGAIAATANANRREYNMATTWLPHLLTNTLTLLLPDFLRVTLPKQIPPEPRDPSIPAQALHMIELPAVAMVRDNPSYALYVAPLAIGYILSHPRFNIYKGSWADIRFAGLGLDALPHGATAFGLTALVTDTFDTAARITPPDEPFAPVWRWASRNPALSSGLVLALATFIWEYGEYRVHEHELKLRGDIHLINMQWSWRDTLNDMVANLTGWIVAMLLRRR